MGIFGIFSFFIVCWVVAKMIWEYESPSSKMDKMDNEFGFIKSDKWYNKHPEAKEIGVMKYYEKYGYVDESKKK